jgi:hypothetical protein
MRRVHSIFSKTKSTATSISYYYDYPEWNEYLKDQTAYLFEAYHRRIWKNPAAMDPPTYCWRFLIVEWGKNVFYHLKYHYF